MPTDGIYRESRKWYSSGIFPSVRLCLLITTSRLLFEILLTVLYTHEILFAWWDRKVSEHFSGSNKFVALSDKVLDIAARSFLVIVPRSWSRFHKLNTVVVGKSNWHPWGAFSSYNLSFDSAMMIFLDIMQLIEHIVKISWPISDR